ncbi:MAG: hypothetical protein V2I36_06330 [Desulfopila sp.]|nr:hypothetical protein [Desulfopila sp.]
MERGFLGGASAVGGVEKERLSSFSKRSATPQNAMKKCNIFSVFVRDDPAWKNTFLSLNNGLKSLKLKCDSGYLPWKA